MFFRGGGGHVLKLPVYTKCQMPCFVVVVLDLLLFCFIFSYFFV